MGNLEQSLKTLQEDLVEIWGEYTKKHDELNLYRGKILDENIHDINRLLSEIHDTYCKLHPTLIFIIKRNKDCVDLLSKYDAFINDIKKAGAQEVKGKVVS